MLARSHWTSIAEVPYHFEAREHGKSNVSMREGLRFVRHLARLRLDPAVRRDRPAANVTGQAFGVLGFVPETPDQLVAMVVRRTAA